MPAVYGLLEVSVPRTARLSFCEQALQPRDVERLRKAPFERVEARSRVRTASKTGERLDRQDLPLRHEVSRWKAPRMLLRQSERCGRIGRKRSPRLEEQRSLSRSLIRQHGRLRALSHGVAVGRR